MDKKTCHNCDHYFQHYTISNGRFCRVYCGHCTNGRLKAKRPDTPACQHFSLRTHQEDEFVSKEYLTKKLLEYILSLELLPDITDAHWNG